MREAKPPRIALLEFPLADFPANPPVEIILTLLPEHLKANSNRDTSFSQSLDDCKLGVVMAFFLMEFVSLENTTAIFETNLFPQAFRRYAHLIDLNEPFLLRGRITDGHGCVTLNVTHVDTRLFYKISKTEKPGAFHTRPSHLSF
jgi:hypothetical protein